VTLVHDRCRWHPVSREYIDYESGWKAADKRKQFAALFDDAAKRKFDCVLFWALDRFSREGTAQTIIHLQRLSRISQLSFPGVPEPHNNLSFSWTRQSLIVRPAPGQRREALLATCSGFV